MPPASSLHGCDDPKCPQTLPMVTWWGEADSPEVENPWIRKSQDPVTALTSLVEEPHPDWEQQKQRWYPNSACSMESVIKKHSNSFDCQVPPSFWSVPSCIPNFSPTGWNFCQFEAIVRKKPLLCNGTGFRIKRA